MLRLLSGDSVSGHSSRISIITLLNFLLGGGIGYGGSTTCASGAVCRAQNAYYSQCIPGTSNPPPTNPTPTPTPTNPTQPPYTPPPTNGGGSSSVPAGTIITQCRNPGQVALTFDDGPGTNMGSLVDTLNAAGAKATFFVTGTLYGCIYNRASFVKKAYDAGHQIGSHTWSHPDLGGLSNQAVTEQMTRLEGALVNIIGVRPTYMRAPYLSTGGQVVSVMQSRNYRIVQATVDTQDWNNISAQQSFQRVQQAGASGNGKIILMHETVASTPGQLAPLVINWAKQNNLKMVTVAECMGDSVAYTSGTGSSSRTC